MSYENTVSSKKKLIGFIIVFLLHVFIIYALVNGLAREFVKKIKNNPVMVSIIEEVKLPPPPPPPPPKIKPPPKPKPKPVAPPPAYIPPPEVVVEAPAEVVETIQAVVAEIEQVESAPIPVEIEEPAPPEPHVPVVVAAKLLPGCETPEYPDESIDMEEEGVSTIRFEIDVDGNVTNAKVTKTSGFNMLDQATIESFSDCKFSPQTVDGTPTKSQSNITYEWKLE